MPSGRQDLDALRGRYRAALPERLQAVRDCWQRAQAGDAAALDTMYTLVHRLAGSGGLYGLPRVSEAARTLLSALEPFHGGGSGPGVTGDARAVEAAMRELTRAVDELA